MILPERALGLAVVRESAHRGINNSAVTERGIRVHRSGNSAKSKGGAHPPDSGRARDKDSRWRSSEVLKCNPRILRPPGQPTRAESGIGRTIDQKPDQIGSRRDEDFVTDGERRLDIHRQLLVDVGWGSRQPVRAEREVEFALGIVTGQEHSEGEGVAGDRACPGHDELSIGHKRHGVPGIRPGSNYLATSTEGKIRGSVLVVSGNREFVMGSNTGVSDSGTAVRTAIA
jgi:hypothetical protein